MNITEKRDFIHSHLHQVREPAINEMYNKMLSLLKESMLEESEEDIKKDNLIPHEALKQDVHNWRNTK